MDQCGVYVWVRSQNVKPGIHFCLIKEILKISLINASVKKFGVESKLNRTISHEIK